MEDSVQNEKPELPLPHGRLGAEESLVPISATHAARSTRKVYQVWQKLVELPAPAWLRKLVWGILTPILLVYCGVLGYKIYTMPSYSGVPYDRHIEGRHQVYAMTMPEGVQFAGEEVPLKDVSVFERFDRELTLNVYWHANTELLIKRTGRWFPIITPIIRANGIPEDFKYVAAIESMFENRTSPAGAAGVWQLMSDAANRNGLTINNEVDERFHLQKATVAACRYIKQAKKMLGNWTAALASYNSGTGHMERAIKNQRNSSYYDLYVKKQTARYVFKLLAFKHILENRYDFGFEIPKSQFFKPYNLKYIKVTAPITDLNVWASNQGINLQTVRFYNPWIKTTKLTASRQKPYVIAIPRDKSLVLQTDGMFITKDSLAADTSTQDQPDDDPGLIDVTPTKQVITKADQGKLPAEQPTKQEEQTVSQQESVLPAPVEAEILFHTVKKGDNLSRIAKKYNTKVSVLVELNHLNKRKPLQLKQQIRVR